MNKELDFENEAQNSKRCVNELKHLGFIYVPKVYDELTTKRVLTMEFIDGINIGNVNEIKKQGLNLKEVSVFIFYLAVRNSFKQNSFALDR